MINLFFDNIRTIRYPFLLLIPLLALMACSRQDTDTVEQIAPEPPKTVAYLILGEYEKPTHGRILAGQVVAAESTQLSFESSGKVGKILVGLGDEIKKGQKLAVIDPINYELRLNQAKAQFSQAVSQRNQARSDVERRRKLVRSGAVSKSELDAYTLQLNSAQEAVNVADAAVKLAKKQLSDTTLRAPFSGFITQKLSEVGQLVSPQVPVFTLATDNTPEVKLSVPENALSEFSMGKKVSVRYPALDKSVSTMAKVSEVSSQASLGAFPIRLRLDNPSELVKPGMTAEVMLLNNNERDLQGFNVPPSAVTAGEGQNNYVFKISGKKDDFHLERVDVTINSPINSEFRIMGALKVGDRIVRAGVAMLSDGQQVILMNHGTRRINP